MWDSAPNAHINDYNLWIVHAVGQTSAKARFVNCTCCGADDVRARYSRRFASRNNFSRDWALARARFSQRTFCHFFASILIVAKLGGSFQLEPQVFVVTSDHRSSNSGRSWIRECGAQIFSERRASEEADGWASEQNSKSDNFASRRASSRYRPSKIDVSRRKKAELRS